MQSTKSNTHFEHLDEEEDGKEDTFSLSGPEELDDEEQLKESWDSPQLPTIKSKSNRSNMPRTPATTSPLVTVTLSRKNPIYLPGDTVSGTVFVPPSNYQSGENNVHIKLHARCKVLIIQNHGEGKDYWRGRVVLFNISQYLTDSPTLVATSNGTRQSYPFSLTIPTHTVPGYYKNNDPWKKASKYLDNAEMDISTHPLPGVFYYHGYSRGNRGQCFVEYILEASLRPDRNPVEEVEKRRGGPSRPGGKKRDDTGGVPTTVVPLVVRVKSTDTPIVYDFSGKSGEGEEGGYVNVLRDEVRVRTMRLLPQYATEQQLGIKMNLKSFFQPSKLPSYLFDLKVVAPQTVQLDHPQPFPFRISVVPKVEGAGSKNSGNVYDGSNAAGLPDVKVLGFVLVLGMHPMMRARRGVMNWDSKSEKYHELVVNGELPAGMVGYVVPREEGGKGVYRHPDESNTLGLTEQYLDLGQLLNLNLTRTHSTRLEGQKAEYKERRQLWPSFKSYNIHLWYEWKYKITLGVSGETQVVEGKKRVEVIGASEQQQRREDGGEGKWKDLMQGVEGHDGGGGSGSGSAGEVDEEDDRVARE
ncbi:hypothetical protein TWF694_004768 [Orbilia ellipsospora]|uniref:Arrestin-like N-terminal domain-containing protein n=1 Tax=Orbilia ellipsospora TaxID=2528407 RepID=A0AAV9WW59_9PEZI